MDKVPKYRHRADVDWIAIEKDYRAGIKSTLQIANEHGLSETAIRKRARKYDWTKDLSAKIRARAAELVRVQEVRKEVRTELDATEHEVIEENANQQAMVITKHRHNINKARTIVETLMAELEQAILNQAEIEEFAELMAIDKTAYIENDSTRMREHQRLVDLFTKITRLPEKSGVIDRLANTLKNLIALERQAFSIDDESGKGGGIEELLKVLNEQA